MRRLLVLALVATACGGGSGPVGPSPQSPPPGGIVVAAVGDIACGSGSGGECRDGEVAALTTALAPQAFLPLGDLQYERGGLADFQSHYDRTWGRFRAISHPVVGNHEYLTRDASGYFDYWNGPGVASGPAGERGHGYYAYDLGPWRAIALNSNCAEAGGCAPGSPQEQWLREELRTHARPCTLATFHHPRYSSGPHGNDTSVEPLWRALAEAGVEVLITGHDHLYERFAPRDGLREFVVGTGGKERYPIERVQPGSEIRLTEFGVLELSLAPGGYAWRFAQVGGAIADSGSGTCR